MGLVTLDEAKDYLRVDYTEDDTLIGNLLSSSENLCMDVARLSEEQWNEIIAGEVSSSDHTQDQMNVIRETLRVAVLYTVAYLYEHRENANHNSLMLTLRALLFGIREVRL